MIVLVHYVAFHADNYQGGSGTSFAFQHAITIPDHISPGELKNYVMQELILKNKADKPFQIDERIAIQKVEIL